jgi:3-methylcrotonyl-CoA carboxylase alpha subunit
MFRRLLIANRGEIACRIIRSARRLGIRSIAVYSAADAGALHVRLADEAHLIGGAAAIDSYLNIPHILQAARAAGAEAIHPGYGFLAENAVFARACEAADIVFVGPSADAIAAMGDKAAAKTLMQRAQVPLLPGYHAAQDDASLIEATRTLGLPLIVKPSAGGGGKGMSIVTDVSQLVTALASSRRMALAAFGRADLILERYLPDARHVEVQILADHFGTAVTVFDRDCSVQRRHQKVIEESPALDLVPQVRERLHQCALSAARAVNYRNAGTIEFLYHDGDFYFLEMNTRLQVEHPVTELVAGIDLVEWQLRIASGEPLPPTLVPAQPYGHAIEVRICAEDATQDFLPDSGQLLRLDWPAQDARVRVDAGFVSHDSVPPYYDSLLGKIIAWGTDRSEAIGTLERALSELRITGVRTNAQWLRTAIAQNAFRNAIPTTRFVSLLPTGSSKDVFSLQATALAWHCECGISPDRRSPWDQTDGFRVGLAHTQTRHVRSGTTTTEWRLTRLRPATWKIEAFGRQTQVHLRSTPSWTAELPEYSIGFEAQLAQDWIHLWTSQHSIELQLIDPQRIVHHSDATTEGLGSLLPGVVVELLVKVGDVVEAGQTLLIVEAMKMEHAIKAPHAGLVRQLHCSAGHQVKAGTDLVVLDTLPVSDSA